MKKLHVFFGGFLLFLVSCTSRQLTRDEAFKLIQQGQHYPHQLDYDIYCGDPEHGKKAIDAGLETQGLLTVQRTQKLGNIGSPLIHFTDKADPYLLPTPEKDKSSSIQKVKLADEDLVAVTAIRTGQSGRDAVVEYTTAYKNLTPFSALVTTDFKLPATRKANFALYDDGWRLEK